jgi:hypothetical protein
MPPNLDNPSLTAYLDKGASLGRDAPCLTLDGRSLSYGEVVDLTHAVARALRRSGIPGAAPSTRES